MELTPLQTAIASNVLASGTLAFAFFYLWFQQREAQAPVFWGAAYLCYCVRQVMILLYAPAGPPLAADLLFIAVPLLILAGTLRFLDRRVPYRLFAGASVVFALGAMAGYYGVIPRQAVWLPTMLASAMLVLFSTGGLLLVHNRRRPNQAHVILAVLFVLWGALLASFPLLLHSIPLRMGYYLANAVALLLIALALIIASQRQQYRVALDAQRAAETANQRFQDVVDTATAWIWEWDAERRIRFISPQVFDTLGIGPEAFIGHRFRDVPGISRVDITEGDADRLFTAARPFRNVPIDVLTTAGRRARISVTGKPIFDASGKHTGFRGITIDITKTARTQATLDAVTAAVAGSVGPDYFRVLVEQLARTVHADTTLIGRCVADGRIRTLAAYGEGAHQPEMEYALSGTPCAITLADGLLVIERDVALLYPEDAVLAQRSFQGYAGIALRSADGKAIGLVAILTRSPIADADFIRTVLSAVAPRAGAELERQVAETALRHSEALFHTVLDHMPIGFLLTDTDGRITLVNRVMDKWGFLSRDKVLGRTLGEIAGQLSYDTVPVEASLREVVKTGQPVVYERFDHHADGQKRAVLINRYPIFDDAGKVKYVASLLTDLSDTKRLETQLRERERLLDTLIESMPIGLLLVDAQHRIIRRNRILEEWSHRSSRPVIGQVISEPEIVADLRQVAESRQTMIRERSLEVIEGAPRPVLVSRVPILGSSGELTHIATLVTDLTEVKRLQAEVLDHEKLFRTVIDNAPIAFQITDATSRRVMVNRTMMAWSGEDEGSLLGRTPRESGLDPDSSERIEREIAEVATSHKTLAYEGIFRPFRGEAKPALVYRFPIVETGGGATLVGTICADLTELKQLQREVLEREALFRAVIDNMPVAFHLTDAEGRVIRRNRTSDQWGNEVVVGQTFSEMDIAITAEERAIVDAEIREVRETGRTLVRERIDSVSNGGKRPVLVCRFPIFDAAGKISLVGSMVTDVSDLKRLEGQLRQSETRLQRIVAALDRSQKGVVVEDASNRPIYINRTASELMGNESSAVAMLERAGIGSEFESHGAWTGEVIHRTRSGNDAILQTSVSRLPDGGSVTLLDDATERLERERRQTALERQVQEAQKMDAVGQLAGGIAHDFNNLIGAILGFARFIAEDTDETSRLHGYAMRILSASQRARELIQQILAFSRRENAPRQPAAVTKLVEESAQLLRATVPATLDIEVRNDFPEAWSLVNQTQITQILVNLCLNAADAMGGKPGTLTLALERLPDVDPRLRWLLASDPGGLPRVDLAETAEATSRCYVGALRTGSPYLVLSVRDQGSGIPAAQLAKIFDPFFTTKPLGQGTGLGLSVVQRLVLAHDGAIVVTTRPGIGTTFDIILPVSGRSSRDIVEAVTRDDPAVRRAPMEAGTRGRVLVVDDDQHFGDMVSTALDRAGYEVGVCSRPREAIEVFSQGPRHWDVVVTDQTMPEMSGLEMIGRLKPLNPALRCILCTGYAVGGLNAATAQAGGADAFFHKPVDVEALITAIAGLIAPNAGHRKSGRPS